MEKLHIFDSDLSDTWSIGYAFYLNAINEKKVNAIQNMVIEHPESPVNKANIICKLIEHGILHLLSKVLQKPGMERKLKRNNRETISSNT